MTQLRWCPRYVHSRAIKPPSSPLTAMDAKTQELFQKLSPFLAIQEKAGDPGMGWPEIKCRNDVRMWHRSLFLPRGNHHSVRWMPQLKITTEPTPPGWASPEVHWRRLNFAEFCAWYGLAPFDERIPR